MSTEKPYRQMSDCELVEAHAEWCRKVQDARGWASAYFAATQVKEIVAAGSGRGLTLENPYPILIGAAAAERKSGVERKATK